jgi:hypothetical protein
MTKALGMTVYLRNDTVATNAFTTVCATSVDGGGVEASSETLEPCLDDTVILEYPADPKYAQQTVEYKLEFSTSTTGDQSTTIFDLFDDAVLNTTLVTYALKIPLATPVYASRTAYVVSHVRNPKERNQDMTSSIVFAPQSAWTYSTTQPSTT